MNLTKIAALALCTAAFTAFAAPTKAETRKVDPFTGLDVGGGFKVTVLEGEPSYVVEGDPEQLAWVKHRMKNGVLEIYTELPRWRMSTPEFTLTVRGGPLKSIDASGGVHFKLDAPTQKTLALNFSGGVEATVSKIAASTLAVEASGGATVKLSGTAQTVAIETSGGVAFDSRQLDAETLTIDSSGGSNLKVRASKRVDADTSGAVNITVSGTAKPGNISSSGASQVTFEDRH